jgi:16S rRNA (uracil1498-N3)-methyltransferase
LVLFYQPELANGSHWLPEEESRHCIKVLRTREGEAITVTDGNGFFYDCRITKADARKCEFSLIATTPVVVKAYSIHIAIAPTKNADRMEWFVEKATELGVDEITLMECEHGERTFLKTERLQKMAISAMKQSQQGKLPTINGLTPFSSVLSRKASQKFIAYVDFTNPRQLFAAATVGGDYLVLIGPEGDFSKEELAKAMDAGIEKVSLGNTRLRTETAGMAACSALALKNAL